MKLSLLQHAYSDAGVARTSSETLLNFQGLLELFIQGHTEASPGNYDRSHRKGKRRTNPVVDGQLVPRAWKKRRREESGAANAPARARTEE